MSNLDRWEETVGLFLDSDQGLTSAEVEDGWSEHCHSFSSVSVDVKHTDRQEKNTSHHITALIHSASSADLSQTSYSYVQIICSVCVCWYMSMHVSLEVSECKYVSVNSYVLWHVCMVNAILNIPVTWNTTVCGIGATLLLYYLIRKLLHLKAQFCRSFCWRMNA